MLRMERSRAQLGRTIEAEHCRRPLLRGGEGCNRDGAWQRRPGLRHGHLKAGTRPLPGSLMRALSEHVTAVHQTLADIAGEWAHEGLAQEDECSHFRMFFGHVRCLRAACDAALELEASADWPCGDSDVETGSTGSCSEYESACVEDGPGAPATTAAEECRGESPLQSVSSSLEYCWEIDRRKDLPAPLCNAGGMIPALNFSAVGPDRGYGTAPANPPPREAWRAEGRALDPALGSIEWKIGFYVNCSHTRLGQHVRVAGSSDALGAWDPLRALPLRTTAADFPLWKSTDALCTDADTAVEYKYVICDQRGAPVCWEEGPNRQLHLSSVRGGAEKSPLVVAETFGQRGDPDRARLQSASTLRSDFAVALCTPRHPVQEPLLLTPSARRHLPPLVSPRSPVQDFTESLAVPLAPQLVREDSFSQLFERADRHGEGDPGEGFQASYELVGDGPLAEGSFGLVWRCRLRATGPEEFAAKIIHKPTVSVRHQGSDISIWDEAHLHRTLQHPNIARLVEYFEDPSTLTLVLECCRGGDLFDSIAAERMRSATGGGFDEHGAATVARHTLGALAYLHSRSIVHRDVKCENVLLERAGAPPAQNVFKLCDFGIAKVDDGEGLRGQVGSPDTVAPEVVAGKVYGCSADLWSIGVVLYMTLAAEAPFHSTTDKQVLQRVVLGDYRFHGGSWETRSQSAISLVESLMTVSPTLRPTAQQALQCQWLQPGMPAHDRPCAQLYVRERADRRFLLPPAPPAESGAAA
uniref:Non-specific serine/threonine protein kinase n=1 Tax=Alexandrium monilatum TaxID=311494 RepID=A0A7S4V724_9DINO